MNLYKGGIETEHFFQNCRLHLVNLWDLLWSQGGTKGGTTCLVSFRHCLKKTEFSSSSFLGQKYQRNLFFQRFLFLDLYLSISKSPSAFKPETE